MSNFSNYSLETPEQIEVDFELAGIGSRFCAMIIDMLLMSLIGLVLILTLAITGLSDDWNLYEDSSNGWVSWAQAAVLLLLMAIFFSYHLFFEMIWRGQTPGKHSLKLRVIKDDGTPITAMDSVIRNLVRYVDILPGFYGVGGAVAFFSPMERRLGDLAAGTIVVKEGELDYRAQTERGKPMILEERDCANTDLTPDERRIIMNFLDRREQLLPEPRAELAEKLALPLHKKYGGAYPDAELYLQALVDGWHNAN